METIVLMIDKVDKDLRQKVKSKAALEDKTLRQVVIELLENYIKQ